MVDKDPQLHQNLISASCTLSLRCCRVGQAEHSSDTFRSWCDLTRACSQRHCHVKRVVCPPPQHHCLNHPLRHLLSSSQLLLSTFTTALPATVTGLQIKTTESRPVPSSSAALTAESRPQCLRLQVE